MHQDELIREWEKARDFRSLGKDRSASLTGIQSGNEDGQRDRIAPKKRRRTHKNVPKTTEWAPAAYR